MRFGFSLCHELLIRRFFARPCAFGPVLSTIREYDLPTSTDSDPACTGRGRRVLFPGRNEVSRLWPRKAEPAAPESVMDPLLLSLPSHRLSPALASPDDPVRHLPLGGDRMQPAPAGSRSSRRRTMAKIGTPSVASTPRPINLLRLRVTLSHGHQQFDWSRSPYNTPWLDPVPKPQHRTPL
jgi:hypothetical protein